MAPCRRSKPHIEPEDQLVIDALRTARNLGCETQRLLDRECVEVQEWRDFCAACKASVALSGWKEGYE